MAIADCIKTIRKANRCPYCGNEKPAKTRKRKGDDHTATSARKPALVLGR